MPGIGQLAGGEDDMDDLDEGQSRSCIVWSTHSFRAS